jgi:cohesin complex subunit SA-1/2
LASGKGTTGARKTTGQAQPTAGAATKAKTTVPRRARKVANAAEAAAEGAELGKELHLASDNPLFSKQYLLSQSFADRAPIDTLLNPSAALQSTVDDLCESLQQTPEAALAEIINCILRACGCNESVDSDSVVDWDGVVDALDNFTESLKQASN